MIEPLAAFYAVMVRTDPEHPPQTNNDRHSDSAVTNLGNATAHRPRQPGSESSAIPSPGKKYRGKNHSRHGIKISEARTNILL
ncbi:hypothetical protein BG74_01145 [Sodalis-like endosymbiont of Proechinophthirus fluctus]|nr:hypothetical protein BG74_01145 [Sodalis-like endosymbiont of Proechinophthirus fluctus]